MMCDLPRSREFDYEALCGASKQVNACIAVDRASDVESRLLARSNELVYATDKAGADEAQTEGVDYSDFIPIPRPFLSMYAQAKSGAHMGLLPELHHAWISIDNQLYLWDYKSKSRDTFHALNNFAARDVILDVSLALPKADVFTSTVSYVLVVVSLLEVTLLSVILTPSAEEGEEEQVQFQRTPYRVCSTGAACKAVSSLERGRAAGAIFLSSAEGSIYELEYSAASYDAQLFPVEAIQKGFDALRGLLAAATAAATGGSPPGEVPVTAAAPNMSFSCQLRKVGRWDTFVQSGLRSILPSFLQPPPGMRLVSTADVRSVLRKDAAKLAQAQAQGGDKAAAAAAAGGAVVDLQQHLVDVVLDAQLGLLLSCSSNGFLKMFRLSASSSSNKGELACCGSFNVISAARSYSAAAAASSSSSRSGICAGAGTPGGGEVQVTRLLLLSTKECNTLQMVVLLSSGARVHLQAVHADDSPVYPGAAEIEGTGAGTGIGLKVLSVLEMPTRFGEVSIDYSSSRSAFYSSGVYVLGDAASSVGTRDEMAGILCLSQDSRLNGPECSPNSIREVVTIPIGSKDGTHKLHSALRDIREDISWRDDLEGGGAPYALRDMALQYSHVRSGTENRRRFLCLESHGIHILVKRQPLAWARTIVEAICEQKSDKSRKARADKEGKMLQLQGLKREYGVTEHCAMVVCAVVMSANPAVCNDDLSLLLLHDAECSTPTLIRNDGQLTFIPSAVARGIRLLFARMTMHLWDLPLTSATFDVVTIRHALDPLNRLESLMVSSFHYGISEVPLTSAEQESMLKPADVSMSQEDKFVKNALENSVIAALYRLVTRTRQLLQLLQAVLQWERQQQRDGEGEGEQQQAFLWTLLEGQSLQALATTEGGAWALQSMLRAGLKSIADAAAAEAEAGAAADALACKFHQAGPCYYHAGDLQEFRAYCKLVHVLQGGGMAEANMEDSLESVRGDLLFAATFWRQVADVGREPQQPTQAFSSSSSSGGSGERHGHDKATSSLGLYCRLLAQIATDASLEILVDLCHAAAHNFLKNGPLKVPTGSGSSSIMHCSYHTGVKLSAKVQMQGRQLCYSHLLSVVCSSDSGSGGGGGRQITERQRQCMLSKSLAMSSDELLLFMMCDALRGRHTYSLLMHLPSVEFVERYLYAVDKSLLYEWYFTRAASAAQAAAENVASSARSASLRTVASPVRLSVNGLQTPDRVVADRISLDASLYMVEQYMKASFLMFEMAGCQMDAMPYAVRPLDMSSFGVGLHYQPASCGGVEGGEYVPIALRCNYLQNAVHAAQGAFTQMCSAAAATTAAARGHVSAAKKQMQQEAEEVCRLRRWCSHLVRLRKLAEIQMDTYKISMAANVYAPNVALGAGSSGLPNKLAKFSSTVEDVSMSKPAAGLLPFSKAGGKQHSNSGLKEGKGGKVETLSSNINFVLGFTLISEDDWVDKYFNALKELCLWDVNLRLLSVFGESQADDGMPWKQRALHVSEALAIRLWKSYIYREVPQFTHYPSHPSSSGGGGRDAASVAGASVSAFLMKQRSETEIDIDTLHNVASRHAHDRNDSPLLNSLPQYQAVPFENYEVWLPLLKGKIEALCKHLEVGDCDSSRDEDALTVDNTGATGQVHACKLCMPKQSSALAAPLAPLIVELDALTAELHRMRQTCAPAPGAGSKGKADSSSSSAPPLRGWVADLLLAVHMRLISVVRAYASIFQTRAKGFGHEKIIKLLESLSYVLLTWVSKATKMVRGKAAAAGGEALSAEDLKDLKEVVCTRELDNWLDLLRHHLSDMQGRHNLSPHCEASLQRIQKEFTSLLSQVDALNFR